MTAESSTPVEDITAVILAGGKARRMGGKDKGLIELHGRPLLDYIISAVWPQAGHILINANRNLDRYREFGYPVLADIMGDFFGPLAGMASGMQASSTPYILTLPCDSPYVPPDLAGRLYRAMAAADAEISVAHDGERLQPVFALLRCELLPGLQAYLEGGGRKIDTWYDRQRLAYADFSDLPDTFLNLNSPEDLPVIERLLAQRQDACPDP
jgi:molybdopterin-guanine dinucleotide biosynthesis protein A